MKTYQLSGEGFVYLLHDGVRETIPITESIWYPNTNPDYLKYRAWILAGGVPLPAASAEAVVPSEVPRWAGRLSLKRHALDGAELVLLAPDEDRAADNLLARVLAWRESLQPGELSDRVDAVLNDAKDWLRESETVANVAAVLGLTPAQVDALFIWAAAQRA